MMVASTGDKSPDRKQVVIWSGGADSTMVLTEKLRMSSQADPVRTLTVDAHHQLHSKLMKSQRAARKRYLAWAKRKGYHIDHATIRVEHVDGDAWIQNNAGQPSLWLGHLTPYLPKVCRISFGYIKQDGFWHVKGEHEAALLALQNLVQGDWELDYPYEWSTKSGVYVALKGWGVPDNCWWTCEEPRGVGKPCGRCAKCRERKDGREAVKGLSKQVIAIPIKKRKAKR